ncbi:MAG: radical SAM protein [Acidobacteriota bacterium]
MEQKFIPKLIAFEVTRTCNLKCKHCRAGASADFFQDELTTEECFKILENISSFAKPIIILTGGEPMMRNDIFEIASYGTQSGLKMVMAPCGILVSESSIEKMKQSGIKRISLSIDGADEETHDGLRQVKGAFRDVIKAAEIARKEGIEFQINTTVSKLNYQELPQILNLAVKLGAISFHPFLLVPTGRGKNMAHLELSPQEYERILNWVYEKREENPINFKPTCAPHYYRILRERERAKGRPVNVQTHGLDAMTKGCMGGQSFAFISHTGKVQICGFLDVEAGDLRKENLDFKKIWDESSLFQEIRYIDGYNGRCGYCEYRKICSGCRARAYAISGNYLDEEPFCIYQPKIKKII